MEVAVRPPESRTGDTATDGEVSTDRLRRLGDSMLERPFGVEITDETRNHLGHDAWRQFVAERGHFCSETQDLQPDQFPADGLTEKQIRSWRESAAKLHAATDALLAIATDQSDGSGVPQGS